MKSVIIILAAMVLMLFAPATLASVDDWRSREYTEPRIVVTGGGVITSDIVLVNDLFSNATANATITSSDVDDAPYPSTYVSATKTLTVAGLAASTTRTLTVNYRIDRLADYLGAGIAAKVLPALFLLGIFGLIAASVYQGTRHSE